MIYPEETIFEEKTGFTALRREVEKRCLSAMGRREAGRMSFATDAEEIRGRLEATAEMLAILSADGAGPGLAGVDDLEAVASKIRIPGSYLTAGELQGLGKSLGVVSEVSAFFSAEKGKEDSDEPAQGRWTHLSALASELRPLPDVARRIDMTLDRHGEVRDNASPALAEIRRRLRELSGEAGAAMRRVLSGAVREGIVEGGTTASVRDSRLVVPVPAMNKRRLSGIVHDESATGRTVFIEPAEVVEVNNRIRTLENEERREVVRILVEVADGIRCHLDDMAVTADAFGRLDFIHAKARYARERGGTLPRLSPEPELDWRGACHPVLKERLLGEGKAIVPLDLTMTGKERIMVVSGPNAGGKSVVLKTVAIIQYMTQCGMLPQVDDSSHVGVFTDIFLDIGDNQSMEDDLSTYSSHLRDMREFTRRGGTKSLVLIDEFGAGTEPQIGGAIAQAILHRMVDNGMWGVVTTHFQNLKRFAEETPGLMNGSMLYDRRRLAPLFRLSMGNAGSSFALEIARQTGLDPAIIAEAEAIAGSDYVKLDRYLLEIARDRRYWEDKRTEIRRKERRLDQMLESYENDAETLRRSRREILDEARAEARRIIDCSNAAVERTIKEIREAQAERERTLAARARLRDDRNDLAGNDTSTNALIEKAPKPKRRRSDRPAAPSPAKSQAEEMAVGSAVKLDGAGTPGRIMEISGKNATVVFGNLKTTVALKRLRPTTADPDKGISRQASFVSEASAEDSRRRQLNFKTEIDVRGMRADEAVQAVTYFIDDAVQFSAGRVRILHGTGTGALRQAIRTYLATVPGVADARDEDVRLGGAGITVVELV